MPTSSRCPARLPIYLFKRQLGEDENGKAVKDLGQLNRDLKNVAIVDNNPEMFRLHTSNGVQIPSFDGDPKDVALLDLIPYLQDIDPACPFFAPLSLLSRCVSLCLSRARSLHPTPTLTPPFAGSG